jgi:hypothetical protein
METHVFQEESLINANLFLLDKNYILTMPNIEKDNADQKV